MSHTHLSFDPPPPVVSPCDPAWLALSAALAGEAGPIAARDDLVVRIAPGAAGDAPARFYTARALIEIDGVHLGVDPDTIDPAEPRDRARCPVVWGAFVHECGHAAHTRWLPPNDTPPAVADAARLLEEPRIEAAQLTRRPDDRVWLRATARKLVIPELTALTLTGSLHAAWIAALVLGRRDAGVLSSREIAPVARTVTDILGATVVRQLRALWRTALRTADDDAATMIELGRRWCDTLGLDPHAPLPTPAEGDEATPALTKALTKKVTGALEAVAADAVATAAASIPTARAAAARADEAAATTATRTAKKVFTPEHTRDESTMSPDTRPPTPAEHRAARALAGALNTAGTPERAATKTTSVLPPGRLSMHGALAREAQHARGALPTAEPFTRRSRGLVHTPPLKIGVACDVSGSMRPVQACVASAAWILTTAAYHARVPVTTATVLFGNTVRPLTRPGERPATVTEFDCGDGWEDFHTALDALDGELGLATPGAARLLVIISDGEFTPVVRTLGQRRLTRLRAAGCALLWLSTGRGDRPLDGARVHPLNDPTTTASVIGHAATAALRAATTRH